MLTPLEMAKIGIRYFIRVLGWTTVARIVRDNKPPIKKDSNEQKPTPRS